jgi:hypothetical protein
MMTCRGKGKMLFIDTYYTGFRRNPLESTGIHRNPPESTGIHWNPWIPVSPTGFRPDKPDKPE